MELADSLSQQRASPLFRRAEALDFARAQPGVALALARKLSLVRSFNALPHPSRVLPATRVNEFVFAHGGHLDLDIDTIEERPRKLVTVAYHLIGRAAAFTAEMSQVSAGTGVHCADQLESRGILGLARGARNGDAAGLERFAQRFEHLPVELRQLVQKQHAVVRQRYFAGARIAASADQRDAGSRVVGSAERALFPVFKAKSA